MSELGGKVIVIFGGTSGMGLATAKAAAARGASVIAAGRTRELIDRASSDVGGSVRFEQLDARDLSAVDALLDKVGGADHLFVTAGRTLNDPALTATEQEQSDTLDSRFWSAVNVAKASARHVRPGGSVTFTSGVAAWKPVAGEGFAAASCAAVESLARQLATDMRPLRFNAIAPGLIDTPLLRKFVGGNAEQAYRQFGAVIPAGRVGNPDEIAHAVLFLMENDYVTGTALVIDGGYQLT